MVAIRLHLLKQFSLTSVISLLFHFRLVFTSADSPSLPVSFSFSLSLSLTPVTVSKVLMRSYLTLHCLIRCCWVSEFAALISWGQLNAILCWISPCNPVCCPPAGAYICAPTVDWPLCCLLLQHTTQSTSMPNSLLSATRSVPYLNTSVSNDSGGSVAISILHKNACMSLVLHVPCRVCSNLEKGTKGDTQGRGSSISLPFQVRFHLEQTERVIID